MVMANRFQLTVIKALGYYSKENILTPECYQLNLRGSKHDRNSPYPN
jgi:hypothetical protein